MKMIIVLLVLLNIPFFCQHDNDHKQMSQFSTGKDKITFIVLDYDTDEPLIAAELYSFDQEKKFATTDINGIAIAEKVLTGNLEISYIGYYSICFKINNSNIDSISLWLKPMPITFGPGVVDLDTAKISPSKQGEIDAQKDLNDGKILLLVNTEPTEEQLLYAKNHNFRFKIWKGDKTYREAYNEVMVDFLKSEYDKNIEEELRAICWRIYQP